MNAEEERLVLGVLRNNPRPLTTREVATIVDLPLDVVHKVLVTLRKRGDIGFVKDRGWQIA